MSLKGLLIDLREQSRLGELTDGQLIAEVMGTDLPNEPLVLELMTRVYPQWADELEKT